MKEIIHIILSVKIKQEILILPSSPVRNLERGFALGIESRAKASGEGYKEYLPTFARV